MPITPVNAIREAKKNIPAFVYECFDKLIVKNLDKSNKDWITSVVKQEEIVVEILKHFEGSRSTIFQLGWLNIEDDYRVQGWEVTYHKAGFNESDRSTFTFKADKRIKDQWS